MSALRTLQRLLAVLLVFAASVSAAVAQDGAQETDLANKAVPVHSLAPIAYHSWDGLLEPEVITAREAAAAPVVSGSTAPARIAFHSWDGMMLPEVIAAREAAAAPVITGATAPATVFHSWDGLLLPEVIEARLAAAAPVVSGSQAVIRVAFHSCDGMMLPEVIAAREAAAPVFSGSVLVAR